MTDGEYWSNMEKVCYVLGAGFSAPLGLPLMSDFLIKAKDMYFSDPAKYPHVKEVIDSINAMSSCKIYFNADLLNIEEILSIIEMKSYLDGSTLKDSFLRFIKDVISYYTPPMKPYGASLPRQHKWYDFIFGQTGSTWRIFGVFIASLFNLRFEIKKVPMVTYGTDRLFLATKFQATSSYSIVTLNYDIVPETICKFIQENYKTEQPITFLRSFNNQPYSWEKPALAKLHGSIDNDIIIPPTWSKGSHEEIASDWKMAFNLINSCNHLRFIGYSLPDADAYVRYLLKSAVLNAAHLKTINVICHDPSGEVKKRFDAFICFNFYRFVNAKTEEYLSFIFDNPGIRDDDKISMDRLEITHNEFVQKYTPK